MSQNPAQQSQPDQSYLLNDNFIQPNQHLTKEQAEEVRKKRLERFGPVESNSNETSIGKDGVKTDDKLKSDPLKASLKPTTKTEKS